MKTLTAKAACFLVSLLSWTLTVNLAGLIGCALVACLSLGVATGVASENKGHKLPLSPMLVKITSQGHRATFR
ncbi:MAG: hypothetical protein R3360_05305, partial [Alphaproteobacteria bacterium]|nr:hypothetical protein [Alphaproteobacteria bacterium]